MKRNRTQRRHEHKGRNFGARSLSVRTNSLNIDDRSIEADVSTENPVLMPDYERGEMIPEVLLTSGVILPDSRQVPFLDSHQRQSVGNQLGSARDISVGENNRLQARLQFSSAAEAEFTKVREGHVTDVSAGYQILKKTSVKRGETKEIEGREYTGPVNVVTQWRLMEVSLTPIGADSLAKLRGLDPDFSPQAKGFVMLKEIRDWCVARGMSVSLTDEEAQKWMAQHLSEKAEEDIEDPEKKDEEDMPMEGMKSHATQIDARQVAELVAAETRKAIEAESKRMAQFRSEVDALCQLADLPNEAEACRSLPDIAAVRKHLQERKAAVVPSYGVQIKQVGSGFENLVRDMGSALTLRCVEAATPNKATQEAVYPVAERSKGASNFKYASMYNMADEYVRALGIDTRQLSREQVAICALFGPERAGIRSSVPAYHTTGSFANLTYDAINKSMQVGYTEAPSTWRGPMRQGTSAMDFKNIHRIRAGAIPNLPVWNDNSNPERVSFADAKETYAVESRSAEISFSYRLLVNDDMDFITRMPSQMGAAAARTVNAVAWAQLTANPTMSDGVALFSAATGNRKRQNLTTGAGAPSVTTVGTLANLMRQMRGENAVVNGTEIESADILNLTPAYIVGPSALEVTINQLVNSAYDPSANLTQVYNPTRVLTPVIEPILDGSSTTAWYLFANTSQIDTIEVTFLQGQETPQVREFTDDRNLSRNYIVLQTFAAKALNHRGVQKHAGA